MYYVLSDDVYLVEGKAKSCLYDLKKSRLYSVNKALSDKIKLLNLGNLKENDIDGELKNILKKFIVLGLIELSDKYRYNDIKQLKKENSECDFAWIEVTNKCNLKCKHCYNESNAYCEKVMSFEKFKETIELLRNIGVKKIRLIGGEPFINNHILRKMLDYVIGKFDYIEIFTNGTLIPENYFEYFYRNNIHIALSVYSYKEDVHDKVTGIKGSWLRTNKTIKKLQKMSIPYRVCNVLMKDVEIGEKNNNLYTLSNEKDIVRMSGRANFSLLTDELIKKRLITKKTFEKPITKAFCRRIISGHNCFCNKIYISSDLEIFPCVMERRLKHGRIDSLASLKLNSQIRNLTKDNIKVCNYCEYRYACFDCRPDALTNDVYKKPWYCTYDPDKGEWKKEEEFINELKTTVKKL